HAGVAAGAADIPRPEGAARGLLASRGAPPAPPPGRVAGVSQASTSPLSWRRTKESAAPGAGARCALGCLSMIVELDLPAPLLLVGRVPPRAQDADLAARQDHRPPDVVLSRPDVLARDRLAMPGQPDHRRVGRPRQI